MEDKQPDAWFYSHESERTGPVTFEELKEKAQQGALNPRLDLVWMKDMSEWMKAGEVEGLFERVSPQEISDASAAIAEPFEPQRDESPAELMGREGEWPGARRRSYILVPVLLALASSFGMEFAKPQLAEKLEPALLENVVIAVTFLPLVAWLYFSLRRLLNLGMSRWWFFGNFVPILNLWVGYRCFACPAGYAFHKKMDGVGIFLAIVYWLIMAIAVLVFIAAMAILLGEAGDPDLKRQIQDLIEANKPVL